MRGSTSTHWGIGGRSPHVQSSLPQGGVYGLRLLPIARVPGREPWLTGHALKRRKAAARISGATKKAAFTAALFDEFDSSFNRGAYGANPRASTTRNTAIGVDNILTIAWGNHADRAFALAGATADALIGDNVSHVTNAPPCFLEYTHYSIRPKAMQLQFS